MPIAGSGEQNERHVLESTKRPLVHRAALGQGPVGELLELDANAIIASKNLFRPRSELVGDLELDSLRMQELAKVRLLNRLLAVVLLIFFDFRLFLAFFVA